ncbi:GMP synthase, small subunit [Methanohalobium evestigatum Z-7303]|uniref:GMP synthase [glutamine-hydrolyzing] subunit A n=1 Tax=Methanohalobium evestigatum (strain ATCC BAA-1072 / DSM 3721 / NBRC 107634 / OCM 161 / Z-7303) TaxID=644295 RepID=D7EB13_METEZ|nr:GMP synthase subunit A [Methanohalobium evestigatum]ADI74530.1 GMP synthase, small subunit [Methanohalobium evestigatum Z-7303]
MEELKILVVNNHGQFCHLIHRTVRDLDMDTKIVSNTLSVDEILEEEPQGLILSGGPTMDRIGNCREYVENIDVPILGICLGHQLIAKTFGGEYGTGNHGGYASIDVEIIEKNDILKGFGSSISTWASHADEVTRMPDNFLKLARSQYCETEAMKHPERPIYGVQWHPEVAHTEKGEELFLNFLEICDNY